MGLRAPIEKAMEGIRNEAKAGGPAEMEAEQQPRLDRRRAEGDFRWADRAPHPARLPSEPTGQVPTLPPQTPVGAVFRSLPHGRHTVVNIPSQRIEWEFLRRWTYADRPQPTTGQPVSYRPADFTRTVPYGAVFHVDRFPLKVTKTSPRAVSGKDCTTLRWDCSGSWRHCEIRDS